MATDTTDNPYLKIADPAAAGRGGLSGFDIYLAALITLELEVRPTLSPINAWLPVWHLITVTEPVKEGPRRPFDAVSTNYSTCARNVLVAVTPKVPRSCLWSGLQPGRVQALRAWRWRAGTQKQERSQMIPRFASFKKR